MNFTDNTISNGVLYFYKISATNTVGETVNSGLAEAYPSATRACRAGQFDGHGQRRLRTCVRIDLAWSSVLGATSYTVKRSTANGGPYTTVANGAGTIFLTYADIGLTSGTTYYYVISATNSIGCQFNLNSGQRHDICPRCQPQNGCLRMRGYVTTPATPPTPMAPSP